MKFLKYILPLSLLLPIVASAQAPQGPSSPQEQAKKLRESVDAEVERLTDALKLEDWQIFYADSILTHDYAAMQAEFNELSRSRVSNGDLFQLAQDKWAEQIYNSMKRILSEEQWTRYLKSGAAKAKKARDKRKK